MKKPIFACFLALTACTPPNAPTSNTSKNTAQASQDKASLAVLAPDWGISSSVVSLNGNLVATGDINSYKMWVDSPALPAGVIDLGMRFTPNTELIAHLYKAGIIGQVIDSDFYAQVRPHYKDLPITTVNFPVKSGKADWQKFENTTLAIGQAIGKEQQAKQYSTDLKNRFVALGKTLKNRHPQLHKIALVQFMDTNNLRMYGESSIFAPPTELMDIELTSLYTAGEWGFSNITLGDLAGLDQDTCLIVIEPFGQILKNDLQKSLVWQRLDFGNSRCFGVLEPIWMYSGLTSMANYADRLETLALTGGKQ